jgi:hypothetical protein
VTQPRLLTEARPQTPDPARHLIGQKRVLPPMHIVHHAYLDPHFVHVVRHACPAPRACGRRALTPCCGNEPISSVSLCIRHDAELNDHSLYPPTPYRLPFDHVSPPIGPPFGRRNQRLVKYCAMHPCAYLSQVVHIWVVHITVVLVIGVMLLLPHRRLVQPCCSIPGRCWCCMLGWCCMSG